MKCSLFYSTVPLACSAFAWTAGYSVIGEQSTKLSHVVARNVFAGFLDSSSSAFFQGIAFYREPKAIRTTLASRHLLFRIFLFFLISSLWEAGSQLGGVVSRSVIKDTSESGVTGSVIFLCNALLLYLAQLVQKALCEADLTTQAYLERTDTSPILFGIAETAMYAANPAALPGSASGGWRGPIGASWAALFVALATGLSLGGYQLFCWFLMCFQKKNRAEEAEEREAFLAPESGVSVSIQ